MGEGFAHALIETFGGGPSRLGNVCVLYVEMVEREATRGGRRGEVGSGLGWMNSTSCDHDQQHSYHMTTHARTRHSWPSDPVYP
jgi:hypothetical protein